MLSGQDQSSPNFLPSVSDLFSMTSCPGFQGCDPGFPGNRASDPTDNIYRRGWRL